MTAIFLIVHGPFSTMLWSLVLIFVGNLCILMQRFLRMRNLLSFTYANSTQRKPLFYAFVTHNYIYTPPLPPHLYRSSFSRLCHIYTVFLVSFISSFANDIFCTYIFSFVCLSLQEKESISKRSDCCSNCEATFYST